MKTENMWILSRRFIFRITLCIPIVWFFIALIVLLYFNDLTKNTSNNPVLVSEITDIHEEPVNKPFNAIDFVKNILQYVGNPTEKDVVFDVDGKKLDLKELGAMGKEVKMDQDRLTAKAFKKYDEGFQKHAFNQYLSDLISKHRTLPDVRDPDCQRIEYKTLAITASIVMCFHNEAWSTLLRSLHSIIDHSPSHLLKEIILVDDFSEMAHLKQPLDDYIKNLTIVSIIRQNQRQGLIRSRLTGAAVAQAEVIIFLDSHIEVTKGWLEPLLDPISRNRTIVVTPIIDTIDDTTFKYTPVKSDRIGVGGFNWNLQFSWHFLSERERKSRRNYIEPVRSPTMAGGLFAIDKSYFNHLGTYDAGLDIWGGENLELSFRIWMCGGTLVTTPCSHVGHIFRKTSPYTWLPGVNVVKRNTVRVAEVWLDEYKKYYYERINYELGNYGDITSRKLLRQRLQCKSFKWYLTEIYPELYIPDNPRASGDIRSMGTNVCLDANTDQTSFNKSIVGYPCHKQGGNQFFMLSLAGEIRRDEGCLEYVGGKKDANKDDSVIVTRCHGQKGNQSWIYDQKNQLYHPTSNLCMALSDDDRHIQMQICNPDNASHRWIWRRKPMNETNKT